MITFKRPWIQYPDNKRELTKSQKKKVTIQGQALPMCQIVQRYQSGQLFGLSSFPVDYEYDGDVELDQIVPFFPDPADPLALQRAECENLKLNKQIEDARKEFEKGKKTKEAVDPGSDE